MDSVKYPSGKCVFGMKYMLSLACNWQLAALIILEVVTLIYDYITKYYCNNYNKSCLDSYSLTLSVKENIIIYTNVIQHVMDFTTPLILRWHTSDLPLSLVHWLCFLVHIS